MTERKIRVAVVGGKLQGLETLYLARKANIETWLIDRNETVPAMELCDRFICHDVADEKMKTALIELLKQVDLIIPAMENKEALEALCQLAEEQQFRFAFDPSAYHISSSKRRSDRLMLEKGIPAPLYYPDCEPPYVVKPSGSSGSDGVRLIKSREEMETFLSSQENPTEWVAQEFLRGPSYSIEIIGRPGAYETYQITEIHMDNTYDCKRVTAPCDISEEIKWEFEELAHKLAKGVELNGIMDVEVIDHEGSLKVLEIDARIPSQTPTVVYHSTGRNQVEELISLFLSSWPLEHKKHRTERFSSFMHVLVGNGEIRGLGEHIMGSGGVLHLVEDFCKADEALTDYSQDAVLWRATFIHAADNEEELEERKRETLAAIRELVGERLPFIDTVPLKLFPSVF